MMHRFRLLQIPNQIAKKTFLTTLVKNNAYFNVYKNFSSPASTGQQLDSYSRRQLSSSSPSLPLNFKDTEIIYKDRTNLELLRSLVVFWLCSFDVLVDHQAQILGVTKKLLGKRMFQKVMEWTIFGQFMVCDDEQKLLKQLKWQTKLGVSTMLAYTAPELHGNKTSSKKGEKSCDDGADDDAWQQQNFQNVLSSMKIASMCTDFSKVCPIVATKITFFTNFSILKLLSDVMSEQTKLIKDGFILPEEYKNRHLCSLLNSAEFHVEFNQLFSTKTMAGNDKFHNIRKLQKSEIEDIEKLKKKMEFLCEEAAKLKVIMAFDAEQTYLQAAIETMILDCQRKFNKKQPIILNTYQCYLKRTREVVEEHMNIAKNDGFCFGGKIVRGAYLTEERKIAAENNNSVDPTNPDYEATTLMYKRVTDFLLNEAKSQGEGQMRLLFATHNQDSVMDVIEKLKEKNIDAGKYGISFAQLHGTRDFISYTLGSQGFPVSKLTHYSNPLDGLAYLSRRLLENRSGLPSPEIERKLPWIELKRRLRNKFKIH